jgi:hypothetical protein
LRASSLSNARVIALLNQHFVPVYISNEDYRKDGPAPAEERAERDRIYRAALKARLSTGTVHVYIVTPDGQPIDSQHVATASQVEELTALLERTIQKLKVPPGQPLVAPSRQSMAPKAEDGARVLHLTARYLHREGNEFVPHKPTLGQTRSRGWGAYAAEDWIMLQRDEWERLLPQGTVKVGDHWDLDRDVAAKVLTHVYPSTENNDVAKNRLDEQRLTASVLSVAPGLVRARLDGKLKMKHPFYHKDDDNFVEASLVGILDMEPATKTLHAFQLATTKATYGRMAFGVVVQSVP